MIRRWFRCCQTNLWGRIGLALAPAHGLAPGNVRLISGADVQVALDQELVTRVIQVLRVDVRLAWWNITVALGQSLTIVVHNQGIRDDQ
jgi:hypothetical protein